VRILAKRPKYPKMGSSAEGGDLPPFIQKKKKREPKKKN
jgi:hypothetical protein